MDFNISEYVGYGGIASDVYQTMLSIYADDTKQYVYVLSCVCYDDNSQNKETLKIFGTFRHKVNAIKLGENLLYLGVVKSYSIEESELYD